MSRPLSGNALKVAVLGDSWVSIWDKDWRLESVLPKALAGSLKLEGLGVSELVVAGFPGFTAERLLLLARRCRLRDMALVYEHPEGHLPMEGDLDMAIHEQGLPTAWDQRTRAHSCPEEDVDLVIVIAGYNDLETDGADAGVVAHTLLQLQQLYLSRGVEVVLVTIGKGRDYVEPLRRRANAKLLDEGAAVDCDELVARLPTHMWHDSAHLTSEGSSVLGALLGDATSNHLVLMKPFECSYGLLRPASGAGCCHTRRRATKRSRFDRWDRRSHAQRRRCNTA